MNTYLTTAECAIIISNGTDYTTDEQTYALEQSYLLVNSFIKPSVKIPAIEIGDGISNTLNAPAILKQAQSEMIRYLLAKMQYIGTEDLQNQYNNNVTMLENLNNGHFAIETQIYQTNIGTNIISETSLSGSINVLNIYTGPFEDYYIVQIDNNTTGLRYAQNSSAPITTPATFKGKTKNSDGRYTLQTCYSDSFVQLDYINVRFIGSLSAGDSGTIHCIPESSINATPIEGTKNLHQTYINY